jgi:glycerophosphoryl diester phosphodiesterase
VGASDAALLLEVKGPRTRADVGRIVDAVADRGLTGRVLLQSFDEQVLRDARELAPRLRRGLLRDELDADPVAAARAVDAVTYNPYAVPLLRAAVCAAAVCAAAVSSAAVCAAAVCAAFSSIKGLGTSFDLGSCAFALDRRGSP